MSLANLFRFRRPAPEPPLAFVLLFGRRPTADSTGLRGLQLRAAQTEWEARLDRFAGVLDPRGNHDPDLDQEAFEDAADEGELDFFDIVYIDQATEATRKYLGETPVYFLERQNDGDVKLFAKFQRLNRIVPGKALLRNPVLVTGNSVAELQRDRPEWVPPVKHPWVS